jgi:uncharacterized repeat protein (TIGR01451 family)
MTKFLASVILSVCFLSIGSQALIAVADQAVINIATTSSQTADPNDINNTAQTTDIIKEPSATGHVFFDVNGNGIQEIGEENLSNVDIIAQYSDGTEFRVTTDNNGNYTIPVRTSNVVVVIDKNDKDIPVGSVISTISNGGDAIQNLGNGVYVAKPVGFFKPYADLSVQKTVNIPVAKKDDLVIYRIIYRNKGISNATNVEVLDTMPPGFEYVSANIEPTNIDRIGDRIKLRFVIPVLNAGVEDALRVVANVQSLTGSQVNEARIVSAIGDPEIADNVSTASVEVYSPTNIPSLIRTGGVLIKSDIFKVVSIVFIMSLVFGVFIWRSTHKSIRWSKPKV